jgi:hypothetical protein
MNSAALGRAVVVPVANPASVRPLLTCAAQLARADDGRIEIVTVLRSHAPADEHAYAWQGLADAEHLHSELGVPIRGRVVHADEPASGVLAAIEACRASLVLMGWRGISSTTDVFGQLIDRIVGHSTVPLAVLRLGTQAPTRVVLPVSADHLLPGGGSALKLASDLAERLAESMEEPPTILRTGAREGPLPPAIVRLGDRVHHDPRRNHQAVAAFATPHDMIIAPVAPTVSGLRAATTHLAWAAPDATLLVAIDVGPQREDGLADAVEDAGRPAPVQPELSHRTYRIIITVRLPQDHPVHTDVVEQALRDAGRTEQVMTWWPADDEQAHVRATVIVDASGANRAISQVMTAIHDAPQLQGAEISYDLEREAAPRHV